MRKTSIGDQEQTLPLHIDECGAASVGEVTFDMRSNVRRRVRRAAIPIAPKQHGRLRVPVPLPAQAAPRLTCNERYM